MSRLVSDRRMRSRSGTTGANTTSTGAASAFSRASRSGAFSGTANGAITRTGASGSISRTFRGEEF